MTAGINKLMVPIPIESKKAVKVEQEQESITFEVVVIERDANNKRWTEDHRLRVLHYLELYIFPHIGSYDIRQIKTSRL